MRAGRRGGRRSAPRFGASSQAGRQRRGGLVASPPWRSPCSPARPGSRTSLAAAAGARTMSVPPRSRPPPCPARARPWRRA